ncbi:MAG: cobalamin B12-binding domain-containing protein, partial [Caulobacteraceae bacterium]
MAGLPSPIAPLIRAVAPSLPPPSVDLAAAELAQLVETEIIPRLVQAHRPVAAADPAAKAVIVGFTDLTLTGEVDALLAFVDDRLAGGQSIDTLFQDLLGPTALLLGDYWNDDRISFTDVTIAVGRLQHLVRALNSRSDPTIDEDAARSAYFVPTPSEQHTFGLFILEDIFQRAGWRTWIETSATDAQTVGAVRSQWFDLLGISASRDNQIDEVAATITAARHASPKPDL